MIDLHMHTTLSDGELSVSKLLDKAARNKIQLISITDHNHALAYREIEEEQMENIITGTELATSFKGKIIEVLGYNIDPEIINSWYEEFYSDDNLKKIEELLFYDLIRISKDNGYQISSDLKMDKIEKGYSKKCVYYDLVENNEGFEFKTYRDFFRNGLSNPDSEFFLDEGRTYPTLEETVDLIKKAGGISILAHPYEYGIDIVTLKEMILKKLDGVEIYHPSCSVKDSIDLLEFCEANNLKGSMGSDFHRKERNIPLGVHVSRNVLSYNCMDWFIKRINM